MLFKTATERSDRSANKNGCPLQMLAQAQALALTTLFTFTGVTAAQTPTPPVTSILSPTPSSSYSMAALAVAGVGAPPASQGAGAMVGAALGGALIIAIGLAVAIRLRMVYTQINSQRVEGWRSSSKKAIRRVPAMSTNTKLMIVNPSFKIRSYRTPQDQQPIDIVPV